MVSTALSTGKKWTAQARQSWIVRDVLIPLIVSRLALVLVGWLAMTMLHHVPRSDAWEIGQRGDIVPVQDRVSPTNHPLVNMWSRWDAGWYYGIAEGGYKFSADQQSNAAFFPVYPMLIRAVHVVIGSHRAMWWFVCGIIVSNAALAVALIHLFLLVRLEFDEETARRAVLYFLIFPTTLFLSAVYAESVLLVFVLGSFYHARKGEWWIAGILGCLATVSRPPGIVLGIALLVEFLLQVEFKWRKVRLNILALGLVPLGLIGFFAYMRYAAGTSTAAPQAQYTWGLQLQGQWRTLAPFFQRDVAPHGTWIDLAFTVVFAALSIVAAFRLRASYAAYAIAYVIFITMWGSLESIPRYVLGCFPAFFLLALFGRNPAFHRSYVPISSGLAALFMAVFAVWGWLA